MVMSTTHSSAMRRRKRVLRASEVGERRASHWEAKDVAMMGEILRTRL